MESKEMYNMFGISKIILIGNNWKYMSVNKLLIFTDTEIRKEDQVNSSNIDNFSK